MPCKHYIVFSLKSLGLFPRIFFWGGGTFPIYGMSQNTKVDFWKSCEGIKNLYVKLPKRFKTTSDRPTQQPPTLTLCRNQNVFALVVCKISSELNR